VTNVAVVAHARKSVGGGLEELRQCLADAGVSNPSWSEVPKSRFAPKRVEAALKDGAELVFVWGGDGMVQRCVDVLAGTDTALAIIPAGTANLLATNLGIPRDVAKAVRIGLRGRTRLLDVGVMNGERFAVMAGTGLDALIMNRVSSREKQTLGRLAYARSGLEAMKAARVRMEIRVDGAVWFKGAASNVLVGNVGTIAGGITVFPDASVSDGKLEVGIVTAKTPWQWLRVFTRAAIGLVARSPYVRTTTGKKISIRLGRKSPYELDGGARQPTKRIKVRVEPGALRVCVPGAAARARRSVRPGPGLTAPTSLERTRAERRRGPSSRFAARPE